MSQPEEPALNCLKTIPSTDNPITKTHRQNNTQHHRGMELLRNSAQEIRSANSWKGAAR
jgi:hypothetical protein